MSEFLRVASVSEIPPGTGREFTAGGRIVALYHVDGSLFALDGVCPHAGGPLGKGDLKGNVVTCPWHGWQFDVTTGTHCLTETIQHTTFPVRVERDDVYVEIPD
jgi:nitrite reductase (NADH) small subunit